MLKRTLGLVAAALMSVVMSASVAIAGTPIVDMQVSKWDPNGPTLVGTVGDNVYSNDPSMQSKTFVTRPGKTVRVGVSLENDGDGNAFTCAFQAAPPKPASITILADGSTDITDAWLGGTFQPSIWAGQQGDYEMRVKIAKKAKTGVTRTYSFGCSAGASSDTMQARIRIKK